MSAPAKIISLVNHFHQNADAYRSDDYKEAEVRQEFINPFFKCLGWDMDNEQGYAEAYKDVIHEEALKIGGATKAPDYCFRIGGPCKFFHEPTLPGVEVMAHRRGRPTIAGYQGGKRVPLNVSL